MAASLSPATLTPAQFCATFNVGKTKLYSELKAGRLKARKIGSKTVILAADAIRWLDALPVMHDDAI